MPKASSNVALQSLDSRGTRPDGATGVHGKKAKFMPPTLG